MLYRDSLLKLLNETIFDNKYSISELAEGLYIDNEEELLLVFDILYIRLSYEDRCLCLGEIIINEKEQKKKKCFYLIEKLISFSKENEGIDMFKVSSIVSLKMDSICEYYKMKQDDCAVYGEIDDNYDFDGFFGNRTIVTNKEE